MDSMGDVEEGPSTRKVINPSKEESNVSLLVAGAISSVLGLIGILAWWRDFLVILKGAAPIALLLGGILAIYVGFDDIQDRMREERQRQEAKLDKAREEIEIVRAKAEQYREELERLKEQTTGSKNA
jgi:hypothetical protein